MSTLTMGSNLAKAAALDFGIQWGCWVLAASLQTEKFYDLAGMNTMVNTMIMHYYYDYATVEHHSDIFADPKWV
jgi:hypothetical protein